MTIRGFHDYITAMPSTKTPRRIVVVGSSCAGKSTFAAKLATVLKTKHVELDALHWEPNWKEADDATFRSRVSTALESDTWVVDGNYTNKIKDLVWPKADALVWLDPSLPVILKRFFLRSFARSLKGELLWGHSKETLRNYIFSRKSLLMWILTTHKRRTEAYTKLIEDPPNGVQVYRIRREKDFREFFERLLGSEQ
jgi:adenylate kinase family enzyme